MFGSQKQAECNAEVDDDDDDWEGNAVIPAFRFTRMDGWMDGLDGIQIRSWDRLY